MPDGAGGWAPLVLGTLPGGTFSRVYDLGETVGNTVIAAGISNVAADADYHAVRWTLVRDASGEWQVTSVDLSASAATSAAYGVAPNGDVVGQRSSGLAEAVRWFSAGGMEVLPGLSGGTSSRANAVNGSGWIVGNSGGHAVLWRPQQQ